MIPRVAWVAAACGGAVAGAAIFAAPLVIRLSEMIATAKISDTSWLGPLSGVTGTACLAAAAAMAVSRDGAAGVRRLPQGTAGGKCLADIMRARFPPLPSGAMPGPPLTVSAWVGSDLFDGNHDELPGLRALVTARLKSQLGCRWVSLDLMPRHAAALAVMFALRVQGGGTYEEVRDRLARAMETGIGDDVSREGACRRVVIEHASGGDGLSAPPMRLWIDKQAAMHGWNTSALMGMLARAREHGILPCADFIWLKSVDRPLFYALNSVGRPSFPVEGIGSACHYAHECLERRPLLDPATDQAVEAVMAACAKGNLGRAV